MKIVQWPHTAQRCASFTQAWNSGTVPEGNAPEQRRKTWSPGLKWYAQVHPDWIGQNAPFECSARTIEHELLLRGARVDVSTFDAISVINSWVWFFDNTLRLPPMLKFASEVHMPQGKGGILLWYCRPRRNWKPLPVGHRNSEINLGGLKHLHSPLPSCLHSVGRGS